MKKTFLILALILSFSIVNAKKVKFSVDMTGQTISSYGVHVSGDFQTLAGYSGGDWASNTTLMAQEADTNIYSIVVDIPAFKKYEYKFLNGINGTMLNLSLLNLGLDIISMIIVGYILILWLMILQV